MRVLASVMIASSLFLAACKEEAETAQVEAVAPVAEEVAAPAVEEVVVEEVADTTVVVEEVAEAVAE